MKLLKTVRANGDGVACTLMVDQRIDGDTSSSPELKEADEWDSQDEDKNELGVF